MGITAARIKISGFRKARSLPSRRPSAASVRGRVGPRHARRIRNSVCACHDAAQTRGAAELCMYAPGERDDELQTRCVRFSDLCPGCVGECEHTRLARRPCSLHLNEMDIAAARSISPRTQTRRDGDTRAATSLLQAAGCRLPPAACATTPHRYRGGRPWPRTELKLSVKR